MTMFYQLRPAIPADLDGLCQVENACFPPEEAATRAAFAARLQTFPESFWVAETEDTVIGLINGCCTETPYLGDELYEPDCPHRADAPWQTVFGLAVLPAYQHQGIATALLEQLISRSRQRGKAGLILTCKAEKRSFYEKLGFLCRGVSDSQHGGAQWFDMVLTL
jgi:ribosomal protein S18 acetylase RimI-like enzyme